VEEQEKERTVKQKRKKEGKMSDSEGGQTKKREIKYGIRVTQIKKEGTPRSSGKSREQAQ